MRKNIILTGLPHSGKSTLLLNLLNKISHRGHALITKEILEENERIGFEMHTPIPFDSVNSTNSVIAHVDFSKKNQVGKYGVNVDEIDFWASKYLRFLDKINRDCRGEFSGNQIVLNKQIVWSKWNLLMVREKFTCRKKLAHVIFLINIKSTKFVVTFLPVRNFILFSLLNLIKIRSDILF